MSKRILLVDDDEDICTMIKMILAPLHYEIESVENGRIALEKLENEVLPDILLLDLMMPQMSGYTLLDQLYTRGLHSSLSMVVMSADLLTSQQMVRLGVKGFLSKPFDITDLQHLMATV